MTYPDKDTLSAGPKTFLGTIFKEEVFQKSSTIKSKYLDKGLIVMADAGQMKQVFLNLILNGLEAMEGPGQVLLREPEEDVRMNRDPGMIEIWVQDDGPGIPDSEVDSIFEPFYTNKRGGYGLGLAVAYKIVDSHEGEIVYMPPDDGKSTFRVILPRGEGGK